MKTLNILIGIVGSGKSTMAKKLAQSGGVILSSDDVRAELVEKSLIDSTHNFQTNTVVFSELYRRAKTLAEEGEDIIFDATNLSVRDRATIIEIGKEQRYKIVGHLVLLDKEECIKRIFKRQLEKECDHYISSPRELVERYSIKLRNNMPTLQEGFHQIITYNDGVEVSRDSRILIATTNVGKISIYSCVLDKIGLPYCTLKDIKVDVDIDETGETELENARLKAIGYHNATGLPIIANDSGLVIEKFKPEDQPGVFVRRYGGKELGDEETIRIFSEKLKAVGGESDSYFNVALVLCDFDGNYHEKLFKSYRYMVATPSKTIVKALPLRSLDYSKELGKYWSEMTIEEANACEGSAIEQQQKFIEEVFHVETENDD